VNHPHCRGDIHGRRERVVGGLGHIDIVVGKDRLYKYKAFVFKSFLAFAGDLPLDRIDLPILEAYLQTRPAITTTASIARSFMFSSPGPGGGGIFQKVLASGWSVYP